MSETPPPSSPDPHDAPTSQQPTPDPTTEAPRPETPPTPRRLLRSRDDRVLGGVCGGLARYFNVDPLIIRIAAVALIFVGGVAVVAYIAALLLVPEDDGTGRPAARSAGRILRAALLLSAVVAGAVIAAAGSAVATAAGGGVAIAAAVIVLGLLMVVFSFRDRRARWLALPALVLAIPAGVVSAAGVDTHHGVGNRDYAPATISDIRPGGYALGIGELVVDLRDMRWPHRATVNLKVDVGTGHALVLVPADVCLQSKTRAGLGYVNLLGSETGGADIDEQRGTVARTSARRLVLDAHVGIGAIEVRHTRTDNGHWDHDRHGPDDINGTLATAGCAGERA